MISGINTKIDKIKLAREAMYVKRCHTVMHIGEYNVGFHTGNMLLLLRMLYPECRKELIWAIVEHDIPERLTGDIPSPSKWAGVVNRAALDQLEEQINNWLLDGHSALGLTQEEAYWLLGIDLLELHFWCLDQMSFGNMNVVFMKGIIKRVFMEKMANMPADVLSTYAESNRISWQQHGEIGQ